MRTYGASACAARSGGMIFTFYKAQGLAVGSSLVEEDKLDLAKELEAKAKEKVQILSRASGRVSARGLSPLVLGPGQMELEAKAKEKVRAHMGFRHWWGPVQGLCEPLVKI